MATKAQRTVRIRVATVIDADGNWYAFGSSATTDKQAMEEAENAGDVGGLYRECFVTVEIPLPKPMEFIGEVEQAA